MTREIPNLKFEIRPWGAFAVDTLSGRGRSPASRRNGAAHWTEIPNIEKLKHSATPIRPERGLMPTALQWNDKMIHAAVFGRAFLQKLPRLRRLVADRSLHVSTSFRRTRFNEFIPFDICLPRPRHRQHVTSGHRWRQRRVVCVCPARLAIISSRGCEKIHRHGSKLTVVRVN